MKYSILIAAVVAAAPFGAAALEIPMPSISTSISESVSSTVNVSNTGSIQSTTKASASTGGNSVGSGGVVKTGNASASSHSSVQSGSGGTDVDIQVETDVNGEKTSKTIQKKIGAGENVSVEVNASSRNGTSSTNVSINGEMIEGDASTTIAAGDSGEDDDENDGGFLANLVASVSVVVGNLFSFLKFW